MLAGRTSVCSKDRCLQEGQVFAGKTGVDSSNLGSKDTCQYEGHMLEGRTHAGRKDKDW